MSSVATGVPLIIWHDVSVFSRDNTGTGDVGGGTSNAIVVMVSDTNGSKDSQLLTMHQVLTPGIMFQLFWM